MPSVHAYKEQDHRVACYAVSPTVILCACMLVTATTLDTRMCTNTYMHKVDNHTSARISPRHAYLTAWCMFNQCMQKCRMHICILCVYANIYVCINLSYACLHHNHSTLHSERVFSMIFSLLPFFECARFAATTLDTYKNRRARTARTHGCMWVECI